MADKAPKKELSETSDIKQMAAMAAAMTAVYGMIFAPSYFDARAKAAAPQCWDLREISGQVFKLNKCTGELHVVDAKASSATKPSIPAK